MPDRQLRPRPYPNAPKLQVEIAQAARRASCAWASGRWCDIDNVGFAFVVLDKVMQLNEHIRSRTSRERSSEGRITTSEPPFAYITYFENWKRRLAKLTEVDVRRGEWLRRATSNAAVAPYP